MTVPSPGMAAGDAFDGQPASLERPVLPDRLDTILGAGGAVAATGTQQGGQQQLIGSDQQEKQQSESLLMTFSQI